MDVTVVTANFKTPELIGDCVSSFHSFYPDVHHIVIDNGGCEESLEILEAIDFIELVRNAKNVGHGPALHQGILLSTTRYVFTLDSDTKVEEGGFLEMMLKAFEADPKLFAIGWLRYVDGAGRVYRDRERGKRRGHPYVHPFASLIDKDKYFNLPPYQLLPAPAFPLMLGVIEKGYHLQAFPIAKYIWHKIAGTRGYFPRTMNITVNSKKGTWESRRI